MTISIAPHVDPDIWEPPYLFKMLENLSDLSDEFHFIISRCNSASEYEEMNKCVKPGVKNILILLSDELGIKGNIHSPYKMRGTFFKIFRTYNNSDLFDNEWVYPIPCGFSCGVGHHSEDGKTRKYRIFEQPSKKLADREIDIFFSGQIDEHRRQCVEYIERLSDKFNCVVRSTSSFGKGFSIDEYYEHLENSKISIVPTGVVIPESFRYFESAKSNCIIISSYPIRDPRFNNWYYEKSPAIFLESWSQLDESLISNLIKKESLENFEEQNRRYFKEYISPSALADYIKTKL